MAPNPSAALRVLLAALIAAGPLPSRVYAGTPPAAPPTTEVANSSSHYAMRVDKSVSKYGIVLVPRAELDKAPNNKEVAVQALVPVEAASAGTVNRSTFNLKVESRPYTFRKNAAGTFERKDGEAWKAVTLNVFGNSSAATFDGVFGVPRNFNITRTGTAAAPAPAPVPQAPPVVTTPPPHQGGNQPAPAAGFPWRSIPINDTADGTAHMKCRVPQDCVCENGSCDGKRIALYNITEAVKPPAGKDDPIKMKAQAATDYYLTFKGGKYHVCHTGTGASWSVPVPALSFDRSKLLPYDIYVLGSAPGKVEKITGKKVAVTWTGAAPAPKADAAVSDDCKVEPAPAGDDLAKKLDELFTNKVERMGAEWAAGSYGGKSGADARKALLADLSGDKKDAAVKALREKTQKEVGVHVDKGQSELSPFMAKFNVSEQDLLDYLCPLLPAGQGGAAAPATAGATGARAQLDTAAGRNGAAAAGSDEAARTGADVTERQAAVQPGAAPKLPFEVTDAIRNKCAARNAQRAEPPPSSSPQGAPPPSPNMANEAGPGPGKKIGDDKEKPDSSADDAKKKKDLQRTVIGGMGGAIVLGVFGFIFGGPIGAIAMGAIGFGIMAGVTYMNNNPIDK